MLGPGSVVEGDIVLERELGRGGVGVVWLATDRRSGQQVAVKLLDAKALASDEARARFDREASASARIDSPHVIRVTQTGRLPDGQPFLVMELLRGRDLKEHLRQTGTLSIAQAVRIVEQICHALDRAHGQGIIHRDLKPANVYLVEGAEIFVKLLDFGIAKLVGDQGLALTATDALIGTPYYMSPEQFVNPRGVDQRTDLWSVAIVAYGCLTGRLPFLGETVGALALAVRKPFPRVSELAPSLPSTLDAWFERALAVDRERRFQSARELASTFIEAASGRAAATSTTTGPTAGRALTPGVVGGATAGDGTLPIATRRRHRGVWLGATAVAVVASLAGAAYLVSRARSPSTSSASAALDAKCEALATKTSFDLAADAGGVDACDKLCTKGQAAGCVALGRALSEATQGRDDARALAALRRACDEGEGRGCAKAGVLLARGRGALRDKAAAAALYQRGCDKDDGEACTHLARAHDVGGGVARDPARAAALYQQGCERGVLVDCSSLGVHFSSGQGVPKDPARATMLFKRACDGGAWIGCSNLAVAHEQGIGVRQDHRLAGELAKKACDGGSIQGCGIQRGLTMGDRSPEADKRAVALFSAGCEDGDARACQYLGWRYEAGQGVVQDDKRAAELFQAACDGDEADACVNAGQMYDRGRGVSQDLPRAVALFRRACDDGRGWGCENLAQAYQAGRGVALDGAKAASLYGMACDLELGVACHNLGAFHAQGFAVAVDEPRANQLWTRGCALGVAISCEAVGYSHLVGRGVNKDEALAARIFADACDKSFLKSCAWLGHLYKAGRGVPRDAARAEALYKKACGSGDVDACQEAGQSR